MSRIGNKPINLPENVTFEVKDSLVTVKGPRGSLQQEISTDFIFKEKERVLTIVRPTEQKRHRALHGLYRSLVNNMVVGVTEGFKIQLEFVGVGYKASVQGNVLELSLGHSHNIFMSIPDEIKITAETQKGKNPIVTLEGSDKQLVGHVAAKIRSLRKVEPYKGKGVRYVGEQVRRKAGKAIAK